MTRADEDRPAGRGTRRALRRSEESFRLLVDSVVDYAIFLLDPDGTIVTWNAGAERLKGYREDEIVGRHYSTFYPEEYLALDLPTVLLEEARRNGRADHSGWRVRRDGSRFWADVVITALFDDTGELTGYAKVTRDMTEAHLTEQVRERALADQREAVERLQELDRWRRDFIGSVVHDLQTPVTAILGFAGLLDDDVDTAEGREILARIRSNARSLQHLIANLRADTSLSEGRVVLSREDIELEPFVRGLVADMAPVIGDHRVELDLEGLQVVADAHALERILRNLLANAGRHTARGTRIRVRAARTGSAVAIEVADEGPGIPDELLAHVFDRFHTGTAGGMGLGLSVVRQYVELHGGTTEVTNDGGACFRFTLPVDDHEP